MGTQQAKAHAADSRTPDRDRLHAIIREKSFRFGEEITLASGKRSNFYFNMKPTMMDPEGARLIAQLMLARIVERSADYVGGVAVGSVPLVACVAMASAATQRPIPGLFVRTKTKDHGTRVLIEGLSDDCSLDGRTVVMVEDATTTGGSVIKAIEAIRAAGGLVDTVLSIVDRHEGAAENLAAAGLELDAIFTAQDFLPPEALN